MELKTALSALKLARPRRLAVAAADDTAALRAVAEARRENIAEPILFGDEAHIKTAAAEAGVDLSGFEIHHAESPGDAARLAVAQVRSGQADMLMKGHLQTAEFLHAVLARDSGLRAARLLSHVAIVPVEPLGRTLFLTDAAMVPYPDLAAKVQLVRNAVEVARCMGVALPKVAPLAAVEVVNPDMPATLDAAALTQMNRRGQLEGCVVDGPLAMDLALSKAAARHKGVGGEVAGQADILLFHNIEAGNSTLKTFTTVFGCLFGGLVMGAAAPIVLSSRSDSAESKLYSIACAAAVCE